jgi:hypothetical protein
MLSSAAFKRSPCFAPSFLLTDTSIPRGDARYSRDHPPGSDPKKTSFAYDDDNV